MTRHGLEAPRELVGGRWVNDGHGVRRWLPDSEDDGPPSTSADVGGLMACPTCHAKIDSRCRTRGGKPRPPHASRLLTRRCPCGEPIPNRRRQKWCLSCKVIVRREIVRRSEAKRRALKREYDRARRAKR